MNKSIYYLAAMQLLVVSASSQSLNLYEDSVHAPFVYGVASADPSDTTVLIWTATTPTPSLHNATINWALSSDSLFTVITASGAEAIDSSRGYTLKVEAAGLEAGMKYYYRFEYQGNYSVTGITYTAFSTAPDSLKLGLVNCSSLFSGYFNGYRHLAEMPGLKGLIHVGDYIYDFVDSEEEVRVPVPGSEDLDDDILEDWRGRHRLYLTDPDLREARRMFPWIVTWDNHDVSRNNPGAASRAFREFVPFREHPTDTLHIWRKVSYGPLLDIFMIDINLESGLDTFPSGTEKAMSDAQFSWLKTGLQHSTATWKFIGSEKLFAQWNLNGLALPGSGLTKTWNGYPESRDSLLVHLRDNNIDNTVILSGDLHMSIWSDVTTDPFDPLVYDAATGNGSIAVEMMGGSISRGNIDEAGIPLSIAISLQNASLGANPQQHYINLVDHGFNTMSLFSDSMVARSYTCPILNLSDSITLDGMRVCRAGDNHWVKALPSSIQETELSLRLNIYPNPSSGIVNILLPELSENTRLILWDATGKNCYSELFRKGGLKTLNTTRFSSGMYLLEAIEENGKRTSTRLVIQKTGN